MIQQMAALQDLHNSGSAFYVYRTHAGAEIDLLIDRGRERVGFEFKARVTISDRYPRQQPPTWRPRRAMRSRSTLTRLPVRSWHFWDPATSNITGTEKLGRTAVAGRRCSGGSGAINQVQALQRLRTLAAPVVETRDIAALLQATTSDTTTILRRLAQREMITHVSRGRWLVNEKIDHLVLPGLLLAPYPAYVSLQSALLRHGLIEPIPSILYAVTPARPRRLQIPLGTISV